jgi:hypothetical protein
MTFAIKVSPEAVPKLVQYLFGEGPEYIGQLVVKLYENNASYIDFMPEKDSLKIASDAILPKDELQNTLEINTSINALPYALTMRYFSELQINAGKLQANVSSREGIDAVVNKIQKNMQGTEITLKGRKSTTLENETEYIANFLSDSDIEIRVNGIAKINQYDFVYEFNIHGFKGFIGFSKDAGENIIYYKGRKITSKPFIKGVNVVLHEHGFKPVNSFNNVQKDEELEKQYEDIIKKKFETALLSFVQKSTDYDFAANIVQNALSSDVIKISEKLIKSMKKLPLITTISGTQVSYNYLAKLNREIWVNQNDFHERFGKFHTPCFFVTQESAALLELFGAELYYPWNSIPYNLNIEMEEIREPNSSDRWFRRSAYKFPSEMTSQHLTSNAKSNIENLKRYMSWFEINVVFDEIDSPDVLLKEDNTYYVNTRNAYIQKSFEKSKLATMPLVYEIAYDFFSENDKVAGKKRSLKELVQYFANGYIHIYSPYNKIILNSQLGSLDAREC